MIRRAATLAFALGVRAWPLGAQGLAEADILLARGDTARAVRTLEALVRRAPDNAEVHYRVGDLYRARYTAGRDTIVNRRKAQASFQRATRLAPDSARYWLALADALRPQDGTPALGHVPRSVSRAYQAPGQSRAWSRLAAAAGRQGWGRWVAYQYRREYSHRRFRIEQNPVDGPSWKSVQSAIHDAVRIPNDRAELLAGAEEDFQTVVDIEPLNLHAAGLLAIVRGQAGRWQEAAAVTQALLGAAPTNGPAWALHGLVLARSGRWREAAAAFATAFTHMTPEQRAPFRDLRRILRKDEAAHFDQMDWAARARFAARYWHLARPVALSGTNEAQTEFYARIVYAQYAWGNPRDGVGGLDSDNGIIHVRYGPPDVELGRNWIYTGARLVFWAAGSGRAIYAVDGTEAYRVARLHFPVVFDNIPIARTLDTVLVQVSRFRGAGDSLATMIVGAIPLQRMTDSIPVRDLPLVTGALVTDSTDREVTHDRVDETVSGVAGRELQYRTWRLSLRPGRYQLRVEALAPSIERGARAVQELDLAPLGGPGLVLSDLVMARRVGPRDSTATRWHEFFIEPSAGRFAPGEPVDLLWEVYDLTPDSTGTTRYDVELRVTVQAIERRAWYMQIIGGIGDATGLSAVGDDRVSLRYERAEVATPEGIRTEYVTMDLRGAPHGRYRFEVVVHDRVGGATAVTAREMTVGTEPVPPTPLWRRPW